MILQWDTFVCVFVLVRAIWGHFSEMWAALWSGPSPSAHFVEDLLAKKLSGDKTPPWLSLNWWPGELGLNHWFVLPGSNNSVRSAQACGVLVLVSFHLTKWCPDWWGRICSTHTEGHLVTCYLLSVSALQKRKKENLSTHSLNQYAHEHLWET